MCQFDELVFFCVVPRFIRDSLREEHDGEKGFLLCRHNTGDNVVMPQAVLGHQKKSAKERLAVMFHFSLPSPSVCLICELCVLLSFVLNMPQVLNPGD